MRSLRVATLTLLAGLPLAVPLAAAPTAGAATIAYPELRVLVPTGDFAIYQPSGSSTRELEFTHITEDTGAGPLEIRPNYNPATGISQGYQALYSSPSPGVWKFAETVPIVGPMVWDPPSDYIFPLDKFWLYSVSSGGGLGSLVARSPKALFCMTSDTYVGGVPNTPSTNGYPVSGCGSPTGTLGLSVGWGDEYDQTDEGEDIDITNLPGGDYWLRAEADPDHYFRESSYANNITDTELEINGDSVKVLRQTHPDSTPPTVALSSPAQGDAVSGTATLTATASGPAPISSVQYLLDGHSIGPALTTAPYTYSWTVGGTTPGFHYLSAQVTDARGFLGTAPAVSVYVPPQQTIGPISFDQAVNAIGSGAVTTPAFSTAHGGDVLLAFVGSDSEDLSSGQTATVSGAGLTWTLVKRANATGGDAEIWSATASSTLSGATVTATDAQGGHDLDLSVLALAGAARIGAAAAASAVSGAPSVALTTTAAGSAVFATANDYSGAIARTVPVGQSLFTQWVDTAIGDTFWGQFAGAPSTAAGQKVTLNDTAPTGDHYNMVAAEVLPGAAPSPPEETPPTISITAPTKGQKVSGRIQVSAAANDNVGIASVQFYLDGKALGAPVITPPYAVTWDTTLAANGAHTLTAKATGTYGDATTSEAVAVTVENPVEQPPCFVRDADVTVHGRGAVTTPSFTTAAPGDVLLAFVSSDGPGQAAGQSVTISGAGLTWTLVKRANSQPGDAEIWTATAPSALSKATVTSQPSKGGYDQSLTVISMQMSNGVGASVAGGAASGPPAVSLATTEDGSLVFGVGNDWDNAIARTLGPNQTLLGQYLDTTTGDTFWSQYTSAVVPLAGTPITLDDTAPTGDHWNLAAVELLGDGPGL